MNYTIIIVPTRRIKSKIFPSSFITDSSNTDSYFHTYRIGPFRSHNSCGWTQLSLTCVGYFRPNGCTYTGLCSVQSLLVNEEYIVLLYIINCEQGTVATHECRVYCSVVHNQQWTGYSPWYMNNCAQCSV